MAEMGDLVRTLYKTHSTGARSLAIVSDNKHIISGGRDSMIKIWDFETGELVKDWLGHSNEIQTIAITSDDKYIISGSTDKTIKIWDFNNGNLIKTLTGHTSAITSIATTTDEKYVVSGSSDKTIKIWDFESGDLIRNLTSHTNGIRSIATTLDNKYIVSGSSDNTIKIWDFETGNLIKTLKGTVYSLAITTDNKYIVSGSDNTIKIWDFEGNLIRTLNGHTNTVTSVAITSDNKHIVSGSHDKTIKIWDFEGGELIKTWEGHNHYIYSIVLTHGNSNIVSSSFDMTIKIWNFIDIPLKYYLKLKNNQLLDKNNNPITLPITDELLKERGIITNNITQDIINQVLSNEIQLVSNKPFNIDLKANKDLSLDKNLHNGEVFILKKEENVPIAKIKGYTSPQLMLPTKDIKFNRLKNVNDINIKANDNDNKVKIIFSIDSGETWLSKKMTNEGYANREIDIEDFTDISENGMSIREFNSIKTNWTEDLVMSGKVRFGYFLEIDNTNTISEVDEIKANIGLYGSWDSKINGIDFTVNYTNEELKVEILKNGTYKINYL